MEMTELASLPVPGFLFVLRVRVLDTEVAAMPVTDTVVTVAVAEVVRLVQSLRQEFVYQFSHGHFLGEAEKAVNLGDSSLSEIVCGAGEGSGASGREALVACSEPQVLQHEAGSGPRGRVLLEHLLYQVFGFIAHLSQVLLHEWRLLQRGDHLHKPGHPLTFVRLLPREHHVEDDSC